MGSGSFRTVIEGDLEGVGSDFWTEECYQFHLWELRSNGLGSGFVLPGVLKAWRLNLTEVKGRGAAMGPQ